MSVRINKNVITMTRGDSLLIDLKVWKKDRTSYVPTEGDRITFALKEKYNDPDPLIVKEIPIDTMTLRIESSETKALMQPGTYFYDIELTIDDGTDEGFVDTIIPNGRLVITEEVY